MLGALLLAALLALLLVNRRQHLLLLQAMLPKPVSRALRKGQEYAEAYEGATILFTDIVQVRRASAAARGLVARLPP